LALPLIKRLIYGKQSSVGVATGGFQRRLKQIKPTYKEMIGRYLAEGRIKTALDELVGTTVGAGFHTTCAKGYEKAKEVVDDFCEEIDLDNLNLMLNKDLWATGTTVMQKVYEDGRFVDVKRIPITSVNRVRADIKTGRILEIEQRIENESPYKISEKELDTLNCWIWNPIDTGVVGRGVMEPFVRDGYGYEWKDSSGQWRTAFRPSLAKINEEIEDMMRVAVVRFAPKLLLALAGFDEAEATGIKNEMKDLQWIDDLVVWFSDKEDKELTPNLIHTDPRSRMHPHIQHFIDKELIGMETPSVKLISETGFTEASSRTAEKVELRNVMPMKRFQKRRVERNLFWPVMVQELNYGPVQLKAANVRLYWNKETMPDLTFSDLHTARAQRGLSLTEYRKNLSKYGIELTEEGLQELESELAAQEARMKEVNNR